MASQENFKIPTVDMGKLGLGVEEENGEEEMARLARDLDQAFTRTRCAYLINHGITKQQISNMYTASAAFYNLPLEVKQRTAWKPDSVMGYIGLNAERYADEVELHEGYVLRTIEDLPEGDVPELRPATASFLHSCRTLSSTIFSILSLNLGKDRDYLSSLHREIGMLTNHTSLRMAHYPPVVLQETLPGSSRFGAHVDYTSITLVFQDDIGGLQVCDHEGTWHDATPVPDTIILMAGEFLQFYSDDKYKALKHRVIIPAEEMKRHISRYSFIYFNEPDDHVPMWPPNPASPLAQPAPTVREYLDKVLVKSGKDEAP